MSTIQHPEPAHKYLREQLEEASDPLAFFRGLKHGFLIVLPIDALVLWLIWWVVKHI